MKFDTKPMEERANKAIASFENTISTVRASQANAGVLANVSFEYYGSATPLNSMADIRVADARTLVITPYDATTLKAMEKAMTCDGVNVYNLGTGNGYSVLDVIKAYEKACGKEIPYVIDPRRPGDIPTCYADPEKSFRELGWKATMGIEEMCEDSWRFTINNQD